MFLNLPDLSPHVFSQDDSPTYWYEGVCPETGHLLRLPRTALAEAIAQHLMDELAQDEQFSQEGKMYGILLVATPAGELGVLKAFSGLLAGKEQVEGWVPPIPGRDRIALEENLTLIALNIIRDEILTLQQLPERKELAEQSQKFEQQLQQLLQNHRQSKEQRRLQRESLASQNSEDTVAIILQELEEQSRREGIERRNLKRQRDAVLHPLRVIVAAADQRILELKQQRKTLSRQLQWQMHKSYCLTNFAGTSLPLQQVMPAGIMPTGTGDCCAPKLLHYAATHQLKPLAMAEFWWGSPSPNGTRLPGVFYGACQERCQPLMGFLLSGLSDLHGASLSAISFSKANSASAPAAPIELSILYEDAFLLAVNKPAGLLSVPGRGSDRQDSILARLQWELGQPSLFPVHRLDQDTSGVLLLAKNRDAYCHLSRQFQQQQVNKVYEAILVGTLSVAAGMIDLPLWGDPSDRPYQKVDWQRGRPSQTKFQVLNRKDNLTRVAFYPLTGRTHQLRVHAAAPQGLGMPILGDRLYTPTTSPAQRLHLHAKTLAFLHPQSGQPMRLEAPLPF